MVYANFSSNLPTGLQNVAFVDLSRQNEEMYNFDNILISNRANIFVCVDMKCHTRSSSGEGTVIINIGHFFFKLAVSNSAPGTHFSKHPEDPPWRIMHNRTDIA